MLVTRCSKACIITLMKPLRVLRKTLSTPRLLMVASSNPPGSRPNWPPSFINCFSVPLFAGLSIPVHATRNHLCVHEGVFFTVSSAWRYDVHANALTRHHHQTAVTLPPAPGETFGKMHHSCSTILARTVEASTAQCMPLT